MPATYKRISVFLALLLLFSTSHAQQITPENAEAIKTAILKVNDEIIQAAKNLNPEKVFDFILNEDRVSLIQDGRLQTREEALNSVKAGFHGLQKVDYQFEQQRVQVISPTIALLTAEGLSTAMTDDGRTFNVRFAQTVLFVLSDGQWRILHTHRSFPPN